MRFDSDRPPEGGADGTTRRRLVVVGASTAVSDVLDEHVAGSD